MRPMAFAWVLLIWVSVAQAASLPYYTQKDFTPVWKGEFSPKTTLARIPQFQVQDQAARSVTQRDLQGQVTVLNFFFASCGGICPMLMSKMKTVNGELASLPEARSAIRMVSFTITPSLDTPEKLSKYAQEKKLDLSRWSLLTGRESEITRVETMLKADKDVPSKKAGEVVHSENVYLLDRDGRIRGIYNASSAADLKLLVKDAADLVSLGS